MQPTNDYQEWELLLDSCMYICRINTKWAQEIGIEERKLENAYVHNNNFKIRGHKAMILKVERDMEEGGERNEKDINIVFM